MSILAAIYPTSPGDVNLMDFSGPDTKINCDINPVVGADGVPANRPSRNPLPVTFAEETCDVASTCTPPEGAEVDAMDVVAVGADDVGPRSAANQNAVKVWWYSKALYAHQHYRDLAVGARLSLVLFLRR